MGLKIGQVAQLTGMTVEAIRYYEKEKILNPERSQGSTYRTYDVWDVFALNEALQYRNMGFALKDIKDMMQLETLEQLDSRITDALKNPDLTALRSTLLTFVQEKRADGGHV